MQIHKVFRFNDKTLELAMKWQNFLEKNNFDFSRLELIDLLSDPVLMLDSLNRKFCIDFISDLQNYRKKKQSIKSELISKACGRGENGLQILDLSAGLGIDAVFLAQLGYKVTAIERNPLIYLALEKASTTYQAATESSSAAQTGVKMSLNFVFAESLQFILQNQKKYDVAYFDPMFPEKKKSALPRQEMVFFKDLVGADEDSEMVALKVIELKTADRLVVKRPIKAPALLKNPHHQLEGKLIRFDVYNTASWKNK